MAKLQRTEAIVLQRTNYGEADRIVQFLTPYGIKSVIAKGVRKEKSKLAGGVELFSLIDVVIREGKGELGILGSASMQRYYRNVLSEYDRMTLGYEALRLIKNGSQSVHEVEWFEVAKQLFDALDNTSVSIALIKAWLYLNYARLLGYELSLYRDVEGERIVVNKRYRYDVSERGLRLDERGDITTEHIKILRVLSERPIVVAQHVRGLAPYLAVCASVAHIHASIE